MRQIGNKPILGGQVFYVGRMRGTRLYTKKTPSLLRRWAPRRKDGMDGWTYLFIHAAHEEIGGYDGWMWCVGGPWHDIQAAAHANQIKMETKSIPSPTHQSFFPNLPHSPHIIASKHHHNTLNNLGSHFMLTHPQELQLPSCDLCTGHCLLCVLFSSTIWFLRLDSSSLSQNYVCFPSLQFCEEYGHLIP